VNGSGIVDATNALFLREVFRDKKKDERIWVNFLRGDPKKVAATRWAGKPASVHDAQLYDSAQQLINPFYAVSTFEAKPDGRGGTSVRRRIANFSRSYVIGCDDIGLGSSAKIGPDRIKLAPSFVIETSPDNHQVGYILSEPIERREVADVLQDALIHQGLEAERDPGQKNVTRYLRMPAGVNGKAAYVEALGKPFAHELWVWEPSRRYSVQDIIDAYGLTLERVRVRHDQSRASLVSVADDPYVRKLDELGLVTGPPVDKGSGGTWIPIRCPNVADHTDGDDTGSAYCVGGGYKCHHGTCEHVTFDDLQSYLALHFDVSDAELSAMDRQLAEKRVKTDDSLSDYAKNFLQAARRRRYEQ